jgi:hypothetical protein
LEEKEKQEKEMLKEIIEEAEEYKIEFYRKRKVTIENNKAANREKEKVSGQNAILQTLTLFLFLFLFLINCIKILIK